MEIAVKSPQGEEVGRSVTLDDTIFGIKPNDHAIYLDVKQYLANQRQGTHKAKERAEIAGSTRKIKKQKGTGTARAGSIKSPIFRGGGRVFGPRPRDYGFKLNRKLKLLARRSALSYKAQGQQITVLDNLTLDAPKTKQYLDLLSGLSLSNHKSLLIIKEVNKNVLLSARNLQNTRVTTAEQLNTYDILHANHLIINEDAVEAIQKSLAKAE
ncbi:MAG: 50S ribosomal protein L4 [Tunicatimonas sp.]